MRAFIGEGKNRGFTRIDADKLQPLSITFGMSARTLPKPLKSSFIRVHPRSSAFIRGSNSG